MPITASSADPRRPLLRGLGQDRDRDPDEAVGPEFQQDRRQQHRADGRRLGVRVRQPGVEREHRHLDREAEEHARRRSAGAWSPRGSRRPSARARGSGTSPARKNSARKLSSINAEPNSVNRKNLIDAYSRFGPPHTPIMKNIGSRTISKKMKNRIRSCGDERAVHADLEQEDQREEALRVVRLREVVPGVDDAQDGDRPSTGSASAARCRRAPCGSGR